MYLYQSQQFMLLNFILELFILTLMKRFKTFYSVYKFSISAEKCPTIIQSLLCIGTTHKFLFLPIIFIVWHVYFLKWYFLALWHSCVLPTRILILIALVFPLFSTPFLDLFVAWYFFLWIPLRRNLIPFFKWSTARFILFEILKLVSLRLCELFAAWLRFFLWWNGFVCFSKMLFSKEVFFLCFPFFV